MPANLPETDFPDVREYLYIDSLRVRLLLAQLGDGLPEAESSSRGRSHRLQLNLARLGWDRERTQSDVESRSLSDLHVSMLEEAATALEVLEDVSESARVETNWLADAAWRDDLRPGMFIRATAETRIIDPSAIMQTFLRLDRAAPTDVPGATKTDEEQLGALLETMFAGEQSPAQSELEQVAAMVGSLYGDGLSIRIQPFGEEDASRVFSGQITDASGFLAGERDALFSRLGPELHEWTTLAHVARAPRSASTVSDVATVVAGINESSFVDATSGSLNRAGLEASLSSMAAFLEAMGLQDAPIFPAISIVPIAIYRTMPTPRMNAYLRPGNS